jgi:Plant transposon protein
MLPHGLGITAQHHGRERIKGKDGKSSCRLELVCDDYLYVWHVNFVCSGAKNDVNIMHGSPRFNAVRIGTFPLARPETDFAGFELTWFYYLCDGIYPTYLIFMSSIAYPRNEMERRFGKQQEAARKAVERVFGVIFKRFGILYRPSRLWNKNIMIDIVEDCCITHNMIVKVRKEKYFGATIARLFESCEIPT